MNQTILRYTDGMHTVLESVTSTIASHSERDRPESTVLVVLQPPPFRVGIREPFDIVAQVSTAHGLAVPGVDVVASLIALKGTNTIISGEMRAISDASGKATLRLQFEAGHSGDCTILVSSRAVLDALSAPGALTEELAKQTAKAQGTVLSTNLVAMAFVERLAALQATLNTTMVAGAHLELAMQMQAVSDQSALASADCIGWAKKVWWGAPRMLLGNSIGTVASQSCINTMLQSQVTSMRDSGRQPIDEKTMGSVLKPLLLEMMLAAGDRLAGLSFMLNKTSLTMKKEKLRAEVSSVLLAAWALLPLPPPLLTMIENGLDAAVDHSTDAAQKTPNGANLTAPIVGYALSESSESTNIRSGMSSCTLEGYARVEPSPRSFDPWIHTGLLEPTWPNMPGFVQGLERAHASTFFRSALWQPFPFHNFNFLFDSKAATPDTSDTTNCKMTYMTKGSSFPIFFDASFNLTTTCPGFDLKCTLNTPDSTAIEGGQTSDSPCKPEYVRMFGPDAIPTQRMLSYGGMVSLAKHLECVGCYERVMGDECNADVFGLDLNPDFDPLDSSTKFVMELNAEICSLFFERLTSSPELDSAGCGEAGCIGLDVAWKDTTQSRLSQLYGQSPANSNTSSWQSSAALRRLEEIMDGSGWNGCYSKRYMYQQNETGDGELTGPTIRHFDPKPRLKIRVHGKESTDYIAFGGVAPLVQLRDKNMKGLWEWTELKLRAIVLNVDGEWRTYQTEILSGGSRRTLDLELLIDGVPAGNAPDSWWRFDNTIEYVNPEMVTLQTINVLFLSGHDGFRVFAVLTVPIFYLNVRGRSRRMPGLFGTLVGGMLACLLVWYQGTVLRIGTAGGPQAIPASFTFEVQDHSDARIWQE